MTYEIQEYRAAPEYYLTHFWNYLDILPKLLVLLSITLNLTQGYFLAAETQKNFIASINAICINALWFNVLNFLRLFRNTGYLIHLIL
jgi:hypothetical protein